MPELRLVFMGSPDFAVPALAALLDAGHRVAAVYSQPPRPAGRGHRTRPTPVQAFADERGIEVRTPSRLAAESEHASFAALATDAAVVAAYGLILPKPMLDAPRLGCVNIHASLLPRWRGAAPIQRAIMAGDEVTGVTIMGMDEGLDTGPILLAERVPITAATTARELHDELSALGARLVLDAVEGLAAGRLAATPQSAAGVTLAPRIEAGEGRLDWRRPAAELERAVRALNPHPGVWFEHLGRRIGVLAAELEDLETPAAPGTLLDDRLKVACGEGALRPTLVRKAGKRTVEAAAFLRGHPLPAGTILVR